MLSPINQVFTHTNLMLERVFPNLHEGFSWCHHDSTNVMGHHLLHTAGSSLLASIESPACDGIKILSEKKKNLSTLLIQNLLLIINLKMKMFASLPVDPW